MAKCRSCGAEINWCEMASGKQMPLNAKEMLMIQVNDGIGEVIPVYMPHFATCPHAKAWKSKKV